MVNREELEICKKRGHDVDPLDEGSWARCKACGTRVREARVKEEMESVPPEQEIFSVNRRVLGIEPQPVDAAELAVCRRRGHKLDGAMDIDGMWRRCDLCKMWTREIRTTEEREDDPPVDQMDLPESIDAREKARAARRKAKSA